MEPNSDEIGAGLALGAVGEIEAVVAEEHLAPGRAVLSTPSMISLMEQAAIAAIDHTLPSGWASVGIEVCIRHLAPTRVGVTVSARAELVAIEGRRCFFKVQAANPSVVIGEGTHQRALVELARLRQRAAER